MREFVESHPSYRVLLRDVGLRRAGDFVRLSGEIISGHVDRNVAIVELGPSTNRIRAYLKREHRLTWRDRLLSAWAGFGLVSKSVREARTLQLAASAGIDVPEVLAAGEDEQGRAFLLVREIGNRQPLP